MVDTDREGRAKWLGKMPAWAEQKKKRAAMRSKKEFQLSILWVNKRHVTRKDPDEVRGGANQINLHRSSSCSTVARILEKRY